MAERFSTQKEATSLPELAIERALRREHGQVRRRGLQALRRLIRHALVTPPPDRQAGIVARLLVGLENPFQPFDLTSLRSLEVEFARDCLAVLRYQMASPIHSLPDQVDKGRELMTQITERWRLELERYVMAETIIKTMPRPFSKVDQGRQACTSSQNHAHKRYN